MLCDKRSIDILSSSLFLLYYSSQRCETSSSRKLNEENMPFTTYAI